MYLPQGYNAFQSYAFGSVSGAGSFYPTQSTQFSPHWGGLQACGGLQGGFGVQASFWGQLMQIQQNLFQGWQDFCGCLTQHNRCDQNGPERPDCFGRHRGHRPDHDRFRNCFGGRPRDRGPRPACSDNAPSASAPSTPATPAPSTPSTPTPAPAPAQPLTRTAPLLPAVRTQVPASGATATVTVVKRATPARTAQATDPMNYGAFGPTGLGTYQNTPFANVSVVAPLYRY